MKTAAKVYSTRRRFRLAHLGIAALTAVPWSLPLPQAAAGTADTFTTGGSLLTPGSYSSGKLPDNTIDVNLTTTTTTLSIAAGALTVESLSQNSATTYTISDATSTATNSTLTLGNAAGFTNANDGVANDLLSIAGTAGTFTLSGTNSGGIGTLGVVLASSGNFNVSGVKTVVISANISESGGSRTLTIGGNTTKTVTLSGVNTFSGGLVITGNETDVASDASLGAAGGSVTVSNGRLGITGGATAAAALAIDPNRSLFLGANPNGLNTAANLSIKGTSFVAVNGAFQNAAGVTGDLVKQGGGTLQLGGVSTYAGNTFLNNGITQLTTGANRLPTATTVSLGQSTTNNGELDLNGQNQQIAGLNSITGTNTGSSNIAPALNTNIVTTSAGASTLTLGGGGVYAFGSNTTQNSGILTGALTVNKTGTGTQTLGGANTYTGATTISGGILLLSTGSINNSPSVSVTAGALTLQNATALADTGTLSLTTGAALNLDAATGTSETIASLVLNGTTEPAGVYTAQTLGALPGATGITFESANTETLTVLNGVSIPEPGTVLGALLLLGATGWTQCRRLRSALAA